VADREPAVGARKVKRLVSVAVAIWLAGCSGPRPAVESVRVAPGASGKVLVTVVVQNRGGGGGQVEVEITLRDRADRSVVGRDEVNVDLSPHERLAVSRELPVSGGGEVDADADVRYPPS
jgi:hypothetical protein